MQAYTGFYHIHCTSDIPMQRYSAVYYSRLLVSIATLNYSTIDWSPGTANSFLLSLLLCSSGMVNLDSDEYDV